MTLAGVAAVGQTLRSDPPAARQCGRRHRQTMRGSSTDEPGRSPATYPSFRHRGPGSATAFSPCCQSPRRPATRCRRTVRRHPVRGICAQRPPKSISVALSLHTASTRQGWSPASRTTRLPGTGRCPSTPMADTTSRAVLTTAPATSPAAPQRLPPTPPPASPARSPAAPQPAGSQRSLARRRCPAAAGRCLAPDEVGAASLMLAADALGVDVAVSRWGRWGPARHRGCRRSAARCSPFADVNIAGDPGRLLRCCRSLRRRG